MNKQEIYDRLMDIHDCQEDDCRCEINLLLGELYEDIVSNVNTLSNMETFNIEETFDEYDLIRGESIMVNLARQELSALRARVEELEGMLKKLQFCDFDRCPICSGGKELEYFKHKEGCELEAILKGEAK